MTAHYATDLTITSGTTTDVVNLERKVLVGLFIPSGIASSSFNISNSQSETGTFVNAYDAIGRFGVVGDISVNVVASKFIVIPPELSVGLMNIKFVFSDSETNKTFTVITRDID